jgi:hypothetical protein
MKSKLEEKIKEAAREIGNKAENSGHYNGSFHAGFTQGAQFGIQAYKEMLEGEGITYDEHLRCSVDDAKVWATKVNDLIAKLQQQAEKIEGLEAELNCESDIITDKCLEQAELIESLNFALSLADKNRTELENELKRVEYEREAASALGHERIKRLESRLKEHEDNGLVIYGRKIELLTARLKDAESFLQKFITKSNGLSFYVREPSQLSDIERTGKMDLVDRLESLYDLQCEAEQYMEKVK